MAELFIMAQQDDVTEIIAAWEAARPDLDVTPLAVFSRLSRIAKHFGKVRAGCFASAGLESWEFDVLAVLRRSPAPHQLSMTALAKSTLVTSGTMTNRVDRLCARELVQRVQNPDDGRGVQVRITATGIYLVDAAISELVAAETLLLHKLTLAERDRLASLLTKLGSNLSGSAGTTAR